MKFLYQMGIWQFWRSDVKRSSKREGQINIRQNIHPMEIIFSGGKINYSLIGSFQHRVNFTIRALSPTCKFSITSAAVEGQQPAPGLSNLNCGVTENVNYAVGTSAYSKAYASYSLAGVASNLYSKILLNSYSANKMEFTVYYSMSPIG